MAVEFRNIAMHYNKANDWRIVHAIVQYHQQDFITFARTVISVIEARP